MAQYRINIQEMQDVHEKLKNVCAGLLEVKSLLSNQRQLLMIFDDQQLQTCCNAIKREENKLEACSDDISLIYTAGDKICEYSHNGEEGACSVLLSDNYDVNYYVNSNNDVGDCTVPMNYAESTSVLLAALNSTLQSFSDDFEAIRENRVNGTNGSESAVYTAQIQEIIANYVSAVAVSNALALWSGQTSETTISGSMMYFGDVGVNYSVTASGAAVKWSVTTSIAGYTLETTADGTVDTSGNLAQLEVVWDTLAGHYEKVREAAANTGWGSGYLVKNRDIYYK